MAQTANSQPSQTLHVELEQTLSAQYQKLPTDCSRTRPSLPKRLRRPKVGPVCFRLKAKIISLFQPQCLTLQSQWKVNFLSEVLHCPTSPIFFGDFESVIEFKTPMGWCSPLSTVELIIASPDTENEGYCI